MKDFKHYMSVNFKVFMALTLLLSVGSASSIASAHHIHGYRSRINRRVRRSPRRAFHHVRKSTRRTQKMRRNRHRRGTIRLRTRRHTKRARRSTRSQMNQNCYELSRQTILNINRDRRHYHLRSLKINGRLNQIGNQRSYQLQRYFSHNTPQHTDEVQYLLNRKHVNYDYYGENIASSPLGTIDIIAVGHYSNPKDANKNKFVYHSKNGYQLANNIENASMNHDEGDQNGHRDNILDKQFKQIGAGSSYDSHDRNYYLAVEFIS